MVFKVCPRHKLHGFVNLQMRHVTETGPVRERNYIWKHYDCGGYIDHRYRHL